MKKRPPPQTRAFLEARHVAKQLDTAVQALLGALPAATDTLLSRELGRAIRESTVALRHANRLYQAQKLEARA